MSKHKKESKRGTSHLGKTGHVTGHIKRGKAKKKK